MFMLATILSDEIGFPKVKTHTNTLHTCSIDPSSGNTNWPFTKNCRDARVLLPSYSYIDLSVPEAPNSANTTWRRKMVKESRRVRTALFPRIV